MIKNKEVWRYIREKTNHDCMLMIRNMCDKGEHKDNIKFCFCQILDIIKEQRFQIWAYENGEIHCKPEYKVYKYVLQQNKYKMELNNL